MKHHNCGNGLPKPVPNGYTVQVDAGIPMVEVIHRMMDGLQAMAKELNARPGAVGHVKFCIITPDDEGPAAEPVVEII